MLQISMYESQLHALKNEYVFEITAWQWTIVLLIVAAITHWFSIDFERYHQMLISSSTMFVEDGLFTGLLERGETLLLELYSSCFKWSGISWGLL